MPLVESRTERSEVGDEHLNRMNITDTGEKVAKARS
jgi:hypothetical protein